MYFPRRGITNTGELPYSVRASGGIIERTPMPVISMALRGLWGSFFSRKGGRAMSNPLKLRLFSDWAGRRRTGGADGGDARGFADRSPRPRGDVR